MQLHTLSISTEVDFHRFISMKEVGKIRKEIELLEFEGHFDTVYGQNMVALRNDKICFPKYRGSTLVVS